MNDAVLVRREGRVLVLVNNNPAARNAITPGFYEGLTAGLAQAEADPGIGAVVLTGAGGFFCAGGDLQQLAKPRELPPAGRRERIEALHDAIRAIRDCGKPVIAAVEGGAAGAGVSFALACDMLVMARDAYFSVAYVKVGLSPDGGATAFLSEARFAPAAHRALPHGRPHRSRAARCAGRGEPAHRHRPCRGRGRRAGRAHRQGAGARHGPHQGAVPAGAGQQPSTRSSSWKRATWLTSLGDAEASEGIAAFFDKRKPDFAAPGSRHREQP